MKTSLFIMFMSLLISANTFAGQRTCVHGNSGIFETPEALTIKHPHKGWGLDFSTLQGAQWVHYTIPVQDLEKSVSQINLKFMLGSSAVYIRSIHVYNGASKVYSATVDYKTLGTNLSFEKNLSLVDLKDVSNGLGISIEFVTLTTIDVQSRQVKIYNVCADLD